MHPLHTFSVCVDAVGQSVEEQRGDSPEATTRVEDPFVASQWQLMWWRFRKHKVAVASVVMPALMHSRAPHRLAA